MSEFCVLIPAYQPDDRLCALVRALTDSFHVVVVDDGSGDEYKGIFSDASGLGATVLTHKENMGKGQAIKTGLNYMKESGSPMPVITADSDGQHSPDDIARMAVEMEKTPDTLIIGGRDFSKMPARSRTGNTITRFFFRLSTGLSISDTQTGLRGLPVCLLDKLIELSGKRYEYEMNMLLAIKEWGCAYREIPISTIYIEGNKSTHFNTLRDGARVFGRVIKYSLSSLTCAGVDYLAYILFLMWFGEDVSYVLARVISSVLNYQLNRRVVFHAKASVKSAIGYFTLVVCVMLLGSFLVKTLTGTGLNPVLAKLIVDGVLYFLNYNVQKYIIFRK